MRTLYVIAALCNKVIEVDDEIVLCVSCESSNSISKPGDYGGDRSSRHFIIVNALDKGIKKRSLNTRFLAIVKKAFRRCEDELLKTVINRSIDVHFSSTQVMKYMGKKVRINETLKRDWNAVLGDIDSTLEKYMFAFTRIVDAYHLKKRAQKKESPSFLTKLNHSFTLFVGEKRKSMSVLVGNLNSQRRNTTQPVSSH